MKWKGFGGMYMIFLSAILALILSVILMMGMHEFEQTELQHIAGQMPDITIDHGVISVKGPQPVIMTTQNGKFKITIDTSKTESELNNMDTQVGVGERFVFIKSPDGKYQLLDMSKIKDKVLHINGKSLTDLWKNNIGVIKAVAFPLMWLGQIISLLATCLFAAFLTYFVTAFMPEEFDFITRMRLSILALTPALLISNILKLGLQHQTAPWFTMLLAMLYFYVMLVLMRRLPGSGDNAPAFSSAS